MREGVERVARVHVLLAEVDVLQRVGLARFTTGLAGETGRSQPRARAAGPRQIAMIFMFPPGIKISITNWPLLLQPGIEVQLLDQARIRRVPDG